MITFEQLVKVHRISTSKNNTTEGFFNVFIFRKISIMLSWVLASLKIKPNLISFVAFSSLMLAGMLLLFSYDKMLHLAIGLIVLGHILDMSDGEVARLNNLQSAFGAFLDTFLDQFIALALPLMTGFGYIFSHQEESYTTYMLLITAYASLYLVQQHMSSIVTREHLESPVQSARVRAHVSHVPILKYLKWDGGFTIFLYSFALFFDVVVLIYVLSIGYMAINSILLFSRIKEYLQHTNSYHV